MALAPQTTVGCVTLEESGRRRECFGARIHETQMSELRKEIFSGRWVITEQTQAVVASEFRFKPFVHDSNSCPFCEGNEPCTCHEVFAIRQPGTRANGAGWLVRVVPDAKPKLRVEGDLGRRAVGFHDLMNGVGAHEIIVETPRHDRSLHELEVPDIVNIIRAYAARITDLRRDKRIRYVLIFKNHGEQADARTVTHSTSQVLAVPVMQRAVRTKLLIAREYYAAKERCIYCDVIRQELKQGRLIVAENADFIAFAPFASRYPFEMKVLPKAHQSDFAQITPAAMENLARILRDVLQKLDHSLGGPPYNLSLHNRPELWPQPGYWATIEHDFHWHIEILPQVLPVSDLEYASGFFYNPVPPELAAKILAAPV